jgi:hypothetical protein
MITEGPVLVTDWPPRTAKLSAAPSSTNVAIAYPRPGIIVIEAAATKIVRTPVIQA